jgi:hypothetical protein
MITENIIGAKGGHALIPLALPDPNFFFSPLLQAMYMFYALAIVCDDFFVPSLEKICEVHACLAFSVILSEAWDGVCALVCSTLFAKILGSFRCQAPDV